LDVEDHIGQQLGSYRLVRLLGQGGFANVYLGEHIHLQTLAAVKVLQMRLVGSNLEQFRNEARTIASLIHPHIVRVLDFGVEDEVPFLVMEYAPHGTLRQAHPKGTRLSPMHVVSYVNQIADALYYAHSRKLMHRDIKPENLLLGEDGKVLLSDFGLVKTVHNTISQTTKEIAGTIAYMAPEQVSGKPRPASDQYALGIVVYEWLSGDRPFHGSLLEIATQHIVATPRPLYGNVPGISRDVEAVIFSALAKDPQQRFATVKDFARAFEQACRQMQPFAPSLPTTILPPSSLRSPFSTALMAVTPPSEIRQDVPGQPQQSASPNTYPVISPSQAGFPTPVNTPPQTMQMNTPPQLGGPLAPIINSSQGQCLPPTSNQNSPRLPTHLNQDNHSHNQVFQSTPANGMLNQATVQKIQNLQRTLVHPTSMADELIKQPVNGTLPAIARSTRHPHPKSAKRWWVILTLALLIVIASSIVTYAFPNGLEVFSGSKQPSSVGHGSSSDKNKVSGGHISASIPVQPGFATLQITPSSKDVKNVFTVSAVTGAPDSAQSQVQARQITASQSQSQTTTTTGSKQTAATRAAGTLTVACRSSSSPLTINAGTVFTDDNKVSVTTDTTVTTSECHTIVPAHAVNAGQSGNIAANDINQPYQGYTVSNEAAFSGGQDAKTTTVVAQSDIDTTVTSLETTLTPEVKQALSGKLKANERSFGNPQCNPTVTSNHPVGDEATNVTVSVLMTCTIETYDNDGTQAMAKRLLSNQAATNPGADYGLTGNITTTIGQPTLADPAHGTISLSVTAEGVWVYQWSDAQKQNLARLVAGRSTQDAKRLLLEQKGVSAANILLPSGENGMLPSNPSNITVGVATVGGL
jgi:serine/threonine protein kinase